jgi:hypothetical protein
MNKKIILISSALLLASLYWGGLSFVKAESDDNVGAVVMKDFPCNVWNGIGEKEVVTDTQFVATPGGNAKLTCHGKVTPNLLVKKPVVWDSTHLPASVDLTKPNINKCALYDISMNKIYTEDWKTTITPSGELTMQCHFHPNQAQQ